MHADKEDIYKGFSKETKLTLLKFLAADGNFEKLDSLELLPVDSKDHPFRTFRIENPDVTYITTEEQSSILPGLEDMLVTYSYLDEANVKDVLEELSSKGKKTNNQKLSNSDCKQSMALPGWRGLQNQRGHHINLKKYEGEYPTDV